MKSLIYIYLFLISINGKVINIRKPSILIIEYFNHFKKPISIQLNGYKFRESTIMPNNKGIFPLKINPGNYYIDNNITFKYKLYNGIKLGLSKYHLKDKLIKKKVWTILDEIEYYKEKEHLLNIRYLLNIINRKKYKINYNLILKINNNNYYYNNIKKDSFYIIKDNIRLKKGKHKVSILSLSNIDYLCSCPSIYDGFYNGRNLFLWYNNDDDSNMTITIKQESKIIKDYVLSLIIENEINIKEKKLPYYLNIK